MSINQSHAAGGKGVVIYNGERILIYYGGCDVAFKSEGIDLPHFKGTKKGRMYLTSHRVIFVNKSNTDLLQSVSMPFMQLRQVELKQPIFGANCIEGKLVAEPQGGFEGVVRFNASFQNGGAIEFGQALLESGRRASANRRSGMEYCSPPYLPPGAQFYQAPCAAYAPPYHDPSYNYIPHHESFGPPPDGMVYMYDAPPPYPGVYPSPSYSTQPVVTPNAVPNYNGYQPQAAPGVPPYQQGYPPQAAPGVPPYQQGYPPQIPPGGAPFPPNYPQATSYPLTNTGYYGADPNSVFVGASAPVLPTYYQSVQTAPSTGEMSKKKD